MVKLELVTNPDRERDREREPYSISVIADLSSGHPSASPLAEIIAICADKETSCFPTLRFPSNMAVVVGKGFDFPAVLRNRFVVSSINCATAASAETHGAGRVLFPAWR